MNPLLEAKRLGQSIWLDNLSRTLLQEGGLKQLIEQDGISGVTSNPSIFHKALDWIEKDTQTGKRRAGRVVF